MTIDNINHREYNYGRTLMSSNIHRAKHYGRKEMAMSKFSAEELDYLTAAEVLGRLATIDRDGQPHVVPVGWRYNADLDTIDVSGRDFATTKKFRNAKENPRVTFLVDEVLPPWRPRAVMVQGMAEAIQAENRREALIRIAPRKVISWGL